MVTKKKARKYDTGLNFAELDKYQIAQEYTGAVAVPRVKRFVTECDRDGFINWVESIIAVGCGSFREGLAVLAKKYPTENKRYYCPATGRHLDNLQPSVWALMLEFAVVAPHSNID